MNRYHGRGSGRGHGPVGPHGDGAPTTGTEWSFTVIESGTGRASNSIVSFARLRSSASVGAGSMFAPTIASMTICTGGSTT